MKTVSQSSNLDAKLITQMINFDELKNSAPPELMNFASEDIHLQKIAQNLHQIFSNSNSNYSQELKNKLEFIIRYFIQNIISTSNTTTDNSKEIKNIQKSLYRTENALDNSLLYSKQIEQSRLQIESENETLKTKFNELVKEKNNLEEKYQNQIFDLKSENTQLKQKISEANDELKLHNYANERNQKQFSDFANQAAQDKIEIQNLNEKLKKKKLEIESMEKEIRELKLSNQSLEETRLKAESYLETTQVELNQMKMNQSSIYVDSKSIDHNEETEKLRTSLTLLSEQFAQANEELISLRKNYIECTSIIPRQMEILALYESYLTHNEKNQVENDNLLKQLDSLERELSESNDTLKKKNQLLQSLQNIVDARNEEDILIHLAQLRASGIKENRKLVSAFEDQLKFMLSLVDSEIYPITTKENLSQDKDFANRIQIEVQRCRQFIHDNVINEELEDNIDHPNEVKTESKNRTEFVVLADQVARNEILRKYCEKLKSDSETLQKVMKLMNCPKDPRKLEAVIIHDQKDVQEFVEEAMSLIKVDEIKNASNEDVENETKQNFEVILNYIQLVNSLLEEISDIIHFNGEFTEIPSMVDEMLMPKSLDQTEIKTSFLAGNQDEFATSFISPKTAKSLQLDSQSNQLERYIRVMKKLYRENKKLKADNAKLKFDLKESEFTNQSNSKEMGLICATMKDLEARNNELVARNNELINEKESNARSADDRIFSILDQERMQHRMELENIQRRYDASIEREKSKTNQKKEKIATLKTKLNEVITSYEDAFQKQKETISELREQHNSSMLMLNNDEMTKENKQLKTQVAQFETERKALNMKIDQVKDEAIKAQAIRDTFWKTQIALLEENMKKDLDTEKQKVVQKLSSVFNCDPTIESIIKSFVINNERAKEKTSSDKNGIDSQAQLQLNEWEQWSRNLFSNITNGEVFIYGSKELRFALGEMLLSSVSHRTLLNKLQSLRTQKSLLVTGKVYEPEYLPKRRMPPLLSDFLICAVFIGRLKKNTDKLRMNSFQTSMSEY